MFFVGFQTLFDWSVRIVKSILVTRVQMIESGEKERLKELLRERLIECGWRDEMKALCRFPSYHLSVSSSLLSFLIKRLIV